MDTRNAQPACLVCGRTSDLVPLIGFEYRGEKRRICPQHLPMLIHNPTGLAGVLPGADALEAADHHD